MSLHVIEGQPNEKLPVLAAAELKAISDPNAIVNKMSTLEIQCSHLKPNLGAISEYKKKVNTNDRKCDKYRSAVMICSFEGQRSL